VRDPERIDRILKKLGEVWAKYPGMRLAQLLYSFADPQRDTDLFYLEDSRLEELLDKKK
jgi:hypothetical protein